MLPLHGGHRRLSILLNPGKHPEQLKRQKMLSLAEVSSLTMPAAPVGELRELATGFLQVSFVALGFAARLCFRFGDHAFVLSRCNSSTAQRVGWLAGCHGRDEAWQRCRR